MAYPLFMGVLQEGIERLAVGLDAVGPWIIPEDHLRPPRIFVAPGNWHRGRGDGLHARHAAILCLLKSLEQIHRNPRMAFHHITTDRDRMHDWKNSGLL